MDPLQSHELKGNWAPVLLTYNTDESVDYIHLKEEIEILAGFGVNGIYTNGTSSEFYNQSEDEFDRISQITAECCNSAGIAFQLGVSHPSPWISLQRLKRIASLQPGAVQIVLPEWSVPNNDEMMNFLERMTEEAAPCGLVLYNPSFAKRVLQPHEWAAIKKRIPNFIGVKVADGDEAWYACVREHAQGVAVFVPGHHLASAIQRGAQGAYSNVACLHPGAAQRWYKLMMTDMNTALEWEARIQAFMSNHIAPFITEQHYSNQAADRFLALVGGWCELSHCLRWPYKSIAYDEIQKVRAVAQQTLPEFIES